MATVAPTTTAAPLPAAIINIKGIIDEFDNEVDDVEAIPFIGTAAKELATLLDPIRKGVDSGILTEVRIGFDAVDTQLDSMENYLIIGGIVTPIAKALDKIRPIIDAAVPAA